MLAAQAPDLREALDRALAGGLPHAVLDGTLTRTGRCGEKVPSVRGEPGPVHDITAARTHARPALYAAVPAGLAALAGAGYHGASPAIAIPAAQRRNRPPLDISARTRNMLLRPVRCRGERGFALLKGRWRALKHVTASPGS